MAYTTLKQIAFQTNSSSKSNGLSDSAALTSLMIDNLKTEDTIRANNQKAKFMELDAQKTNIVMQNAIRDKEISRQKRIEEAAERAKNDYLSDSRYAMDRIDRAGSKKEASYLAKLFQDRSRLDKAENKAKMDFQQTLRDASRIESVGERAENKYLAQTAEMRNRLQSAENRAKSEFARTLAIMKLVNRIERAGKQAENEFGK